MACLIIGDSIAVGLAAALSASHPSFCDVRASEGARVRAIIEMIPARRYRWTIVSAGSNDQQSRVVAADLARLRRTLRTDRIIWVYPRSAPEAWAIYWLAMQKGDRTVNLNRLPSSDGVHPNNYKAALSLIWPQLDGR